MENVGYRPSDASTLDIDSEQVRFKISSARLLPIIQSLSSFEWPHPLHGDSEERDKSWFNEYHEDFRHKTSSCFWLRRLLNYLVRKGHLQENMESSAPRGSPSPPSVGQRSVIDTILAAPKLAHARGHSHVGIFLVGVNYNFGYGSA